jgi:UDP-N-acetylmuramoyl-tripeptide--D-alanyl-D-alanine ligase
VLTEHTILHMAQLLEQPNTSSAFPSLLGQQPILGEQPLLGEQPSARVATGVAFHSQQVRPGDAFFAFAGEHAHGIRFADDALARGAAFVVSDKPHPQGIYVADPARVLLALGQAARAQRQGVVLGVTGSAGKTTTKTLVAAALACDKSQGNFNTPLALAKTLLDNTLNGLADLPLMLELGIDHIGEMDVLTGLAQPDIGFLTLIAESHLKGMKTLENVSQEKRKLLDASKRNIVSAEAWHFLNAEQVTAARCYGLLPADSQRDGQCDLPADTVFGRVLQQDLHGQVIEVLGERITLRTLGAAAARSAVAAMVCAAELDVELTQAAKRMSQAVPEGRRLERQQLADLTFIDDAYNSNPASMANALDVLRAYPKPHTLVVGDMLELADKSELRHRELGRATRHLDQVIAVGQEARFIAEENPQAQYFATVDDLLEQLADLPRQGTLLVKASLGMNLARFVQALRQSYAGRQPARAEILAVDTLAVDTPVTDTLVTDTAVTDTAVTDTAVTDTAVTDTAVDVVGDAVVDVADVVAS